jgi:hypothetical protein
MQDAEPIPEFDDFDWDRTTQRLSEAERTSRYEAHVARFRRETAGTDAPKAPADAT